MQSNGNQLDVNENGLHLNGVDENGKHIKLSVDKNGLVMNGDGVSMNFSSDEDTYEEDAKPLEGMKNYNKKGQLLTIITKDGTIQNFDAKGDLINIFRPNGLVKVYQNRKLSTVMKNGQKMGYNYFYNTDNKTNNKRNSKTNDPYNTVRFLADNGFSYVVFELNGENIWKCYRNNNALGDLKLIKDKPYFDGHEASSEELKRLGLLWYNNRLNPLTGGFQIVSNATNDGQSNVHYDEDDVIEERVEALTNRAENMQQMVAGSKCRKMDVQWFTWANARLIAQKGLIDANKSKEGLDNVENELNAIQKQFDKIKAGKKNSDCGECKECNEEVGFVYSYGTDELSRKFAEIKAQQAQMNADIKRRNDEIMAENKRKFNEESKRKAEQKMRDAEQKMRDREQIQRDKEQSMRDREQSERDREQAKRDATSGAAKDALFKNLVKEGYLSVNKKCTVRFDNDELVVNGTALSDAVFKRYLADYQQKLGKKSEFSLSFSGIITQVNENGVNMTGRFSLSNND